MSGSNRRTFLKQSATGVAALAAARCVPARDAEVLSSRTLLGVVEAVLPSELGPSGYGRIAEEFTAWVEGFEPAAELDHGYISSEITYAPADPAPGWGAQLTALDLISQRAHGRDFVELAVPDRQALIRQQIGDGQPGVLPQPIRAGHVAIAVLAFFYSSPEAADLCYGVVIGDRTCRSLAGAASVTALPDRA